MTQPDADLERLRFVDSADVYKAGELAATLRRTEAGVEFAYRSEWVDAGGARVASTLPVSAVPITRPGGALPAYFTGLLPEGRRLGALRRAVKTSADDELSLLLAVGSDAIGDVQVVPSGLTPSEVPARVVIQDVGAMSFAALLDELGTRPQRSALPGVQDKTSAAMINLPVARSGERHILKLNPPDFPHLVENEAFFLSAAGRSGLTVPPHEVVTDSEGALGLLVRRFDRLTFDSRAVPLAIEDGCQVLGRPPADKYLMGSGATFAALAALCDAPVVAGRDLIRQLAFAYLTGNGDAHAKNFSVLQSRTGEWRVSPVYDVPSSYPYGDTTMAMTINGRGGGDFGSKDFLGLGLDLNVPERAVRRTLTDLADRVELWVPDLGALPFDRGVIVKLRRVIEHRRKRVTA
jgi:serine/threonine-protein kinase HipA